MPGSIKNMYKMYADDTKLISDGDQSSQLLNDLDKIMDLKQKWLLKL